MAHQREPLGFKKHERNEKDFFFEAEFQKVSWHY
jgi:hypothetical protein